MPELIPAEDTVKALIVALLEMPMDAIVEVRHPEVPHAASIASVSVMPNVGYGQQYVNLELSDA